MLNLLIAIVAIAAAFAATFAGVIAHRAFSEIGELETEVESLQNTVTEYTKTVNKNQTTLTKTDELLGRKYQTHEDAINRLLTVTEAMNDRIDKIAIDEKEIRSYYVNFREPAPKMGVSWANTYRCNDDDLTETLALVDGLERVDG